MAAYVRMYIRQQKSRLQIGVLLVPFEKQSILRIARAYVYLHNFSGF